MNSESIKQKMKVLRESILEIEPILKFSSDDIANDSLKIRSAERLFQLIIDSAVDINTEIIATNSFSSPDSYQGTFYTLREAKILDSNFADKIAPSVGLRNRLVHRYETIKPKLSVDEMKRYVPFYVDYLKIINDYITKTS